MAEHECTCTNCGGREHCKNRFEPSRICCCFWEPELKPIWIPCSERLPEVYEKVLTYNNEGIIHDNFRLNLKDGSVGWSQGWGITHWQSRPEPPKNKKECNYDT